MAQRSVRIASGAWAITLVTRNYKTETCLQILPEFYMPHMQTTGLDIFEVHLFSCPVQFHKFCCGVQHLPNGPGHLFCLNSTQSAWGLDIFQMHEFTRIQTLWLVIFGMRFLIQIAHPLCGVAHPPKTLAGL